MSNSRRVVLFIVCTLLLFFTAPKLYRMKQITGAVPGAKKYPAVVKDKWRSNSGEFGYYDLSWEADIPERGGKIEGQDRAEYEDWKPLQPGSQIQVVVLSNNEAYYTRSIYAGEGNFIVDYCLLAGEIGGMLFAVGGFLWRRNRRANT